MKPIHKFKSKTKAEPKQPQQNQMQEGLDDT